MDALVKALEEVTEATEWFVRTPSLRALHIVTSSSLRLVVLKHLCAVELLDFNTSPFFVLEAPTEPGDDGWTLRSEELRADWEALAATAPGPDDVGPLWPPEGGSLPVARFALELGRAIAALRGPMAGLIIVLAPVWVRDARRWREDLSALLQAKSLGRARFIVVEADDPAALPVFEKLGSQAERLDARVSSTTMSEETNAALEAIRNAPAGASSFQLVGGAGPAVAPPIRRGQPAPLTPDQRQQVARETGTSAALLDPDGMKALRVLVLSAAGAMRDGDGAEAVRLQREARDFCADRGLAREAVVNELVLAGYVLQAGRPERALEIFRAGRVRAEQSGMVDMAVQAQIAVASCLLLMKSVDQAALAYADAGQLGTTNGSAILAIEAYRMCGQLLAGQGQLQQAVAVFRKALDIGEAGGDDLKRGSSFPEAARQLATLCRKHGLVQQADSLDAQAASAESVEQVG